MKKSKLWLQRGPFQLLNPSRPQFTLLKIVVIISTSSDYCAISKALTQHWELRGKAQQVASTSLTCKHRSSSTFFKDQSKHASNLQCILDVSAPLGSSPSVYPLQVSLSKKKEKKSYLVFPKSTLMEVMRFCCKRCQIQTNRFILHSIHYWGFVNSSLLNQPLIF